VSEKLKEQATTAGVQDSRKAEESRSDHLGGGNAPKGLGWRQTGVYSRRRNAKKRIPAHSDFVAGDNFTGRQRVTWSTWYLEGSKTGAYGDPTVASAATGKIILDAAVANGVRFLREYWSH